MFARSCKHPITFSAAPCRNNTACSSTRLHGVARKKFYEARNSNAYKPECKLTFLVKQLIEVLITVCNLPTPVMKNEALIAILKIKIFKIFH